MAIQVLVPVMGEAIGEARLATWLKRVGDPVRRGDELAELETDKAVLMLECPADGVLLEILVPAGAMVTTGQLLARVGRAGEQEQATNLVAQMARAEFPAQADEESLGSVVPEIAEPKRESEIEGRDRLRISPAARRMARRLGIDVKQLGVAKAPGRVTTQDVAHAAEARESAPAGRAPLPQRRVRLTENQRAMAVRMAQSVREIPQFSVVMDADATRLLQVREELAAGGAAVSFTALLVHLTGRVLAQHPMLNAAFDGDAVILYETVNMGVAVAAPQGLVVPVLHAVERLGVAAVARQLEELAQTARNGRLSLAQVSDGTFTLSNLGMYGVTQFVPLVNPPQVAILGVAGIQGAVVPSAGGTRHIQRLALTVSADHRVVDGAGVAAFLRDLRQAIEDATII